MRKEEAYTHQESAQNPFCDLLSFGNLGGNPCPLNLGRSVNSHNNFLQFSGVILDNLKGTNL